MAIDRGLYVGGDWIEPVGGERLDVVAPGTGRVLGRVAAASAADVDRAVRAAHAAAPAMAALTVEDRAALLRRLATQYERRLDEVAETISAEVGCPISLARAVQAPLGIWHIDTVLDELAEFPFVTAHPDGEVIREPIGVVAMITPWNWPIHQIMSKLAYAIAAGDTCVLKPSELAPLNALILAECVDRAGFPAGAVNVVTGTGETAGEALARHPAVRMVSFTGSVRAGARVAELAAPQVARVTQELGGKSPHIVLPGAVTAETIDAAVRAAFHNNGQSCDAPTRLLVSRDEYEKAQRFARATVDALRVGPAADPETDIGPVISRAQFDRVQALIAAGIADGATVVAGGTGAVPGGVELLVRPTVLAGAPARSAVVREEVFGPVLVLNAYDTLDAAVAMANDTEYGLAAYVTGTDDALARQVARRLQAGQVKINFAMSNSLPFGGYRKSGNGREHGRAGLSEFLETKAVIGG